MPQITFDIDIWCSCGKGLCSQSEVGTKKGIPSFIVEPCENCLQDATDEGYNKGYKARQEEQDAT